MSDPGDIIIRTVFEGVLMKLGDVILISGSGVLKKGAVITLLLVKRKIGKKKSQKKVKK